MHDEQTPPKPDGDALNAATLAEAMQPPKLLRSPAPLPVPPAPESAETSTHLH